MNQFQVRFINLCTRTFNIFSGKQDIQTLFDHMTLYMGNMPLNSHSVLPILFSSKQHKYRKELLLYIFSYHPCNAFLVFREAKMYIEHSVDG